jgi:hypothetical protein
MKIDDVVDGKGWLLTHPMLAVFVFCDGLSVVLFVFFGKKLNLLMRMLMGMVLIKSLMMMFMTYCTEVIA